MTTKSIHLHGALTQFSEDPIELAVNDVRDVVAGLKSRFAKFKQFMFDNPEYTIILTDKDATNPRPIHPEFVLTPFVQCEEIHMFPVTSGAGLEIGAAVTAWLVAAGVNATIAAIISLVVVNIATALIVGAIANLLSPQTKTDGTSESPDARPSFLYNGPENVVEQGYQVPIVYGTHMTGSVVVSAGITVEQLPPTSALVTPPANGTGADQPASPAVVPWQWDGQGGGD